MRVELDETVFRLVGPDNSVSELAPYGAAAFLEYEGVKYYCFINDPDDEPHVMRIDVETEVEAAAEDTEFEVESDDGEDEEDEEEEELEEIQS